MSDGKFLRQSATSSEAEEVLERDLIALMEAEDMLSIFFGAEIIVGVANKIFIEGVATENRRGFWRQNLKLSLKFSSVHFLLFFLFSFQSHAANFNNHHPSPCGPDSLLVAIF